MHNLQWVVVKADVVPSHDAVKDDNDISIIINNCNEEYSHPTRSHKVLNLVHFESTSVTSCRSRHLSVDLARTCVVAGGGGSCGEGGRGALFQSVWGAAGEQMALKCSTELDGHDVVEDGVDGTVCVDHEATEEKEPQVLETLTGERIVDDIGSVGQPENGKDADNHSQHLRYLHIT